MSITAGALPYTLRKLNDVWPGSMVEADFRPETDVLDFVKSVETADITYPTLTEEYDAKIAWVNDCDVALADCTDECTFSGNEADVYSQTLTIDQCKESKFSVNIAPWLIGGKVNLFGFSDFVATELLKHMKAHVEYVAQYCVTTLNANLGVNEEVNIPNWTVSGTDTAVPGSDFGGTRIMGGFARTAKRNRMRMPSILDGGALWEMEYMARTSQGNGEGKGDAVRLGTMPLYVDMFNVPAINTTDEITYMVNKGAIALASKGWYTSTPYKHAGERTQYSVTNRFAPYLVHDILEYEDCSGGVNRVNYKITTRFKMFVNPTGCTATRTGILKFTKTPSGV